jgi:DNA-binding transcriptional regulator YiaG
MSVIAPELIRADRMRQGLSLREASKAWSISHVTIHSWEAGYRKPAGLYLAKLKRFLKRVERELHSNPLVSNGPEMGQLL